MQQCIYVQYKYRMWQFICMYSKYNVCSNSEINIYNSIKYLVCTCDSSDNGDL